MWLCKEANFTKADVDSMSYLSFLTDFDISMEDLKERIEAMKNKK